MTTAQRYWVYHRDEQGELHTIGSEPVEATSEDAAISEILRQAGADDDGGYEAREAEREAREEAAG